MPIQVFPRSSCQEGPHWSIWTEPFQMAEEALAEAYESTRPEHRAWIKTTLALVRSRHAELPTRVSQTWEQRQLGFGHEEHLQAAPWAVFVLAPGFASPVRLAASLMTARLAQVNPLLVVRLASPLAPSFPPALLTTLELAGVDHALCMPYEKLSELLALLTKQLGTGRLVLHLDAEAAEHQTHPIWHLAAPMAARCQCLQWVDHPPLLGLGTATQIDEELLFWAHPDARLVRCASESAANANETRPVPIDAVVDAVYLAHAHEKLPVSAPLCLPGQGEATLVGCWLHPTLAPEFFIDRVCGATRLAPVDADSPF